MDNDATEKDLMKHAPDIIMKYFAYGSNMDPVRMKTRGAHFISRQHVVLSDYYLDFNKIATGKFAKQGEGKGNIVSKKGEVVEGALYEISESGRDELDSREIGYERITVSVSLDDETEVQVFTYIALPSNVGKGLKPTKEYLSHYLAAKDILSPGYYQKLKSWPTLD